MKAVANFYVRIGCSQKGATGVSFSVFSLTLARRRPVGQLLFVSFCSPRRVKLLFARCPLLCVCVFVRQCSIGAYKKAVKHNRRRQFVVACVSIRIGWVGVGVGGGGRWCQYPQVSGRRRRKRWHGWIIAAVAVTITHTACALIVNTHTTHVEAADADGATPANHCPANRR